MVMEEREEGGKVRTLIEKATKTTALERPSPPQGYQIGFPLFRSGALTRRPDPYGP
jgi:hypothetical protein